MLEKILNNGHKMPMLVFGTFNISESEMKTTIETAITSGYRHFDCASIYRNEEAIGDSLTEIINSGLIDREELYLTSKAWMTHYRDIRSACINSLRRLKTPYLDQYLLHWPIVWKSDGLDLPAMSSIEGIEYDYFPLQQVWQQMEQLVDEGLVRSIGVSNWTIALLNDMFGYARIRPVVNQFEISIYNPKFELVDFCKQHNIVPVGYRLIYKPENDLLCDFKLCVIDDPLTLELSQKYQVSPSKLLISWCLSRDCAVITKSVTPERIRDNFESKDLVISKDDHDRLNSINTRGVYCDPFKGFGIHLFH